MSRLFRQTGWDIGAHTRNHTDLTATTSAGVTYEMANSRTDLTSKGLTPVDTFAYPLGAYNASVEAAVQAARFAGARSTDDGFNDKSTDKYALKMQEIHTVTTPGQVESWINTATSSKTWLILLMHKVQTGCTTDTECITPADLQTVVSYLKDHNVSVVTMHEGMIAMGTVTPASRHDSTCDRDRLAGKRLDHHDFDNHYQRHTTTILRPCTSPSITSSTPRLPRPASGPSPCRIAMRLQTAPTPSRLQAPMRHTIPATRRRSASASTFRRLTSLR